MKKLVLVLGMHRSGTSVTTGILNKMGLPLGSNLMPPSKDNPKGYYENMDFYHFNEMILRENDSIWHNVKNLKSTEFLNDTNKNILKSILKKYDTYEIFGVKDPRICVLLPLYEEVCNELGIEIIYVRVDREKEGIIKSIQKRDRFSNNYINEMIEQYLKDIPNVEIKIKFEDVIYNTEKVINFLFEKLPFLNKNFEVFEFVDINLKRN